MLSSHIMRFSVQKGDEVLQQLDAPEFEDEWEKLQEFLSKRPNANLLAVKKNCGFAVKFTDEDGRLASPSDVNETIELFKSFAEVREDMAMVRTDGYVDFLSFGTN